MGTPRILLLDIETAPSLGYFFNPFPKSGSNILHVEEHWFLLSFAYKWLGDRGVKVRALSDYPRYRTRRKDDRDLLRDLWKLLDEADIVVAQNGDGFDIPKINARLVTQGFVPPSPYKTVDTYKWAKRFGFDFRRLDFLAQQLGIGAKLPHTGTHMWLGCVNGDPKSWRQMRRYNAHDVYPLLEGVYHALKGFSPHPNLSLITRADACPTCQSTQLQHRGWRYLSTSKRRRLQCQDCGAWSQGKETIKLPKV